MTSNTAVNDWLGRDTRTATRRCCANSARNALGSPTPAPAAPGATRHTIDCGAPSSKRTRTSKSTSLEPNTEATVPRTPANGQSMVTSSAPAKQVTRNSRPEALLPASGSGSERKTTFMFVVPYIGSAARVTVHSDVDPRSRAGARTETAHKTTSRTPSAAHLTQHPVHRAPIGRINIRSSEAQGQTAGSSARPDASDARARPGTEVHKSVGSILMGMWRTA